MTTAWTECEECGDDFPTERYLLGYTVCLACGEAGAREARKSWCVLTPHKQGAMFFTAESARDIAKGINNKGGLYR
jgi:hypothetical protein